MIDEDPRLPISPALRQNALKTVIFTCTVFVLCILAYQAWKVFSPSQVGALSPGELSKIYRAEGILVRNETVIVAPASGRLNLYLQEGEKVRAGESIGEVQTLSGDSAASARNSLIRAPRSGLVIRQTDGLEGVLNPGQVDILEVAGLKLKAAEGSGRQGSSGDKCEKGQPVMKVVDNLSPLAICLQAPDGYPPARLKKGGHIKLVWENNHFQGQITEVRDYGGRTGLVIQSQVYPAALLQKRKVALDLEGETVTGCLVPVKALVEKDGQPGLLIISKQRTVWVPVRVEGTVNGRAAVSGTGITPGVRYLIKSI